MFTLSKKKSYPKTMNELNKMTNEGLYNRASKVISTLTKNKSSPLSTQHNETFSTNSHKSTKNKCNSINFFTIDYIRDYIGLFNKNIHKNDNYIFDSVTTFITYIGEVSNSKVFMEMWESEFTKYVIFLMDFYIAYNSSSYNILINPSTKMIKYNNVSTLNYKILFNREDTSSYFNTYKSLCFIITRPICTHRNNIGDILHYKLYKVIIIKSTVNMRNSVCNRYFIQYYLISYNPKESSHIKHDNYDTIINIMMKQYNIYDQQTILNIFNMETNNILDDILNGNTDITNEKINIHYEGYDNDDNDNNDDDNNDDNSSHNEHNTQTYSEQSSRITLPVSNDGHFSQSSVGKNSTTLSIHTLNQHDTSLPVSLNTLNQNNKSSQQSEFHKNPKETKHGKDNGLTEFQSVLGRLKPVKNNGDTLTKQDSNKTNEFQNVLGQLKSVEKKADEPSGDFKPFDDDLVTMERKLNKTGNRAILTNKSTLSVYNKGGMNYGMRKSKKMIRNRYGSNRRRLNSRKKSY